jgi:hypothetical protein
MLTLSTTSVLARGAITQAAGPTAAITLTIANPPSGALYLGYAYTSVGVATVGGSTPTGVPPSLVITFKAPYLLKPGTYADSIQLELCADAYCVEPLTARQFVTISYVVGAAASGQIPATTLSTNAVSAQAFLTSYPGISPQAPAVSVGFTNVPVPPTVSTSTTHNGVASVAYAGTSASNGGALVIYLKSPVTLGAGVYQDTVTVNACLDSKCNNLIAPVTMGVTYTVTNTATGANGYTINAYPITATDIAWDGVNGRLMVSLPASAAIDPGAVATLDPLTGQLSAPTAVPGTAAMLALAADSSYLYVSLADSSAIQRYVLPGMTPDIVIPLPIYYEGIATYVRTMQVAPDDPHTIAVTMQDASGNLMGLIVFDDATARAGTFGFDNVMPVQSISSAEWGSSSAVLYGAAGEIGDLSDLYQFSVDASGVALQMDQPDSPGGRLHYAQNLLYVDSGAIVVPASLQVIGSFAAPQSNLFMVPDTTLNRAFIVNTATPSSSFSGAQIESYDLTTQAPIATVPLPYGTPLSRRLVRWGADGLAFVDLFNDQIVVVNGPFVTP